MEGKVIVIAGPTCSGKTFLSILLAEKLRTEIISADSRQIYKYLDIGTAKPGKAILDQIKHHFINILEPDDPYDVSLFENDALNVIKDLLNRNMVPVVAGGSGLYIKGLINGIFDTASRDDNFRIQLEADKEKYGVEYLHDKLKKIDPVSASKLVPQNWKRVMRALEVFSVTGRTIGELHSEHKRKNEINFIQYGLLWDREVLYKSIDNRVDDMLNSGLIEEVVNILNMGYSSNLNSLNTVGYKEIISHLKGEITLTNAVELIKRNTRRYAKRQMTWFGADKRLHWLSIKSKKDLFIFAGNIIKQINTE